MKKMKRIMTYTAAIWMLLCSSCSGALDTKLNDNWGEDIVWKNPNAAEGVLVACYNDMMDRPDAYGGNFLDAATDNAFCSDAASMVSRLACGDYSAANFPLDCWDKCYRQFQRIHEFRMKGLSDDILYDRVDPATDMAIKNRLLGETYYLRAYWSLMLLQTYAGRTAGGEVMGYPIVLSFASAEDASTQDWRRDPFEDCVEQILADCDSATMYLPMEYKGNSKVNGTTLLGRATTRSAEMIRSRTLLLAASPAYQKEGALFPASKWERAAILMGRVLASDSYWTFYGIKSSDLACGATDGATSAEFIQRKYFTDNGMEKRHYPPFYYGTASTQPSQELVDAFPAQNGFPISDPRSGYDPEHPWSVKRDRRMDICVYHHGQQFGKNDSCIDISPLGKDSPNVVNASQTGYYLAKFMSDQKDLLLPTYEQSCVHYYPSMRRAEMFLNYAEAANEAWGPHYKNDSCPWTAYEVIQMVRAASGGITDTVYLDEMASSKESFRKLIQNERRLEFAFENFRFYDIRRWRLPLDNSIHGIAWDGNSYSKRTLRTNTLEGERYYYMPLPENVVKRSPLMENNIGW